MNTSYETMAKRTISPEDEWRYNSHERALMIAQGYIFENEASEGNDQEPNVHDSVWPLKSIIEHCKQVRSDIEARSETVIDIPV